MNAAKAAGFEETSMPDHFGAFGGRYIPETLAAAHAELEKEYEAAMADPAFREELAFYRKQFIGGPTPLYADRVEMVSIGPGRAMCVERMPPAVERCKNQQERCSYGRDQIDARRYLEDEAQCRGVCCVDGSACARVQSDGRAFCIELSTPLPRNADKAREGSKGVFVLDCGSENNREVWLATLVKHGAQTPSPPPSPSLPPPPPPPFWPGPQETTGLP